MSKTVLVPAIPNREITAAARQALKGRWGIAVGVSFLMFLITITVALISNLNPLLAGLGIINVTLSVGLIRFFLLLVRGESVAVEQLFFGFKKIGTVVAAYMLMMLYIFLWFLLLIIPGIIATYNYFVVYYVLADDPAMSASDALKRSKALMYGHRFQVLMLSFRFIGWFLLCVLTLGIGFIWLFPYMNAAFAVFYNSILPGKTLSEAADQEEAAPVYGGMSVPATIGVIILFVAIVTIFQIPGYYAKRNKNTSIRLITNNIITLRSHGQLLIEHLKKMPDGNAFGKTITSEDLGLEAGALENHFPAYRYVKPAWDEAEKLKRTPLLISYPVNPGMNLRFQVFVANAARGAQLVSFSDLNPKAVAIALKESYDFPDEMIDDFLNVD
ncbi:MAG: DUF975 family protein [Victivallaceae bacterium]|nr:DUF975 family protein [Victivallaceae bacterium]